MLVCMVWISLGTYSFWLDIYIYISIEIGEAIKYFSTACEHNAVLMFFHKLYYIAIEVNIFSTLYLYINNIMMRCIQRYIQRYLKSGR